MYPILKILEILLPFLYGLTFGVYLFDFIKGTKQFANSKRIFLFVTLAFHIFYLIIRTIELNHPPITNVYEIFTVLAFSLSCSYFILELFTDIRGTGLFIIVFSMLLQFTSSVFIHNSPEVKEILRNRLLGLHVINAIIGYSGITISAVYGVLFWLLYKEIKLSKFGLVFERLPSLDILENLSYYSAVIGFIFLSIAILIGIIWLPSTFPNFNHFDPKLIGTALIWLMYGIGVASRLLGKLQGKRVIVFSIIGFLIAIISTVLTNFITTSFHSFY